MMDAVSCGTKKGEEEERGEENRDKIEQRGGNGEPLSSAPTTDRGILQPSRFAAKVSIPIEQVLCVLLAVPSCEMEVNEGRNITTNLMFLPEKFPYCQLTANRYKEHC